MLLNISNDAIFIADSHYNNQRIAFELFLDTILTKQISTSQLFLMGDMFDFLTYEVDYFKNINQDVIDKLNILSKQIEIIYLEGNHDFSIDKLFPNIIVIPRDIQPLIAQYKDKKIAISHGDIFTPTLYNIFTFILRNDTLLRFLNFLDKNDTTSKWI
jgi:UDP-2,3-diacylglucosamine hydrolase